MHLLRHNYGGAELSLMNQEANASTPTNQEGSCT